MPKLGDALKSAVRQRPEETPKKNVRGRPSSVLMNPNRRRIFQFLCRYPCSRLGRVAAGASLSRSSAKWHLDILARSDYVLEFSANGKPRYCPSGFISPRNLPMFTVLASPANKAVYRSVLNNPGSDAGMLASVLGMPASKVYNALRGLHGADLITRMADGRYARYFPTEVYRKAAGEERMVRKEFVRKLIRRLEAEHLKPEVRDLKGPDTTISIGILGEKDALVIAGDIHNFD